MEDKEFEEKAIPLITEGFDLETDGMEFLQKLSDKNISVISIIGPVSSGKSFLATQISGQINKGFEISPPENKECCTKGIWVWGKPVIKNDFYIIILDVQGLRNDTEENLEYSQKIFSLCTLISSVIIYNYKNDNNKGGDKLTNENIEKSYEFFNQMLQFLQKIKLEDNEEINEDMNKITSKHLPDFVWIYRDSQPIDFNTFNDCEKKFLEKNAYFNSLLKNKIKKYALPCPMDLSKMKSNTYLTLSDNEIKKGGPFTEKYKTSFNNLKNKIFNLCTPKQISNLSLNGNLFYGLLQEYASAIYSGESMFVESPLSTAVYSNLGDITENVTETFKEKLEEKNTDVNDIIQIMKNSFEVFSDGLLDEYNNHFIGKLLHSQFMAEQINNILSSVSDEVLDTMINDKLNQFNDSIKELTEKESEEKPGKIKTIPDIKKNLNELASKIQKQVEENIFKKENEFLNSFVFIKDYIIKCICNKINSYADSIQFYIENNLQTVESSSKTNEAAFEAKIQELNEKEIELNKYKIEIEKMKQNKKDKEKEYKTNLSIEKQKYENLKKEYENIIKDKDKEIKSLEAKKEEKIKEIENIYSVRSNKNEISEIEKKNIQLQIDLGLKEKEINQLKSKLKDLENINLKQKANKGQIDSNLLKENDIPKLKTMFKTINQTITDYTQIINKLEQNKQKFFHDKFVEINKTDSNKAYNNWNIELNKFKEEHFNLMESNYNKELSKLKKENNYLESTQKLEIKKLNKKIKSDKEIIDKNKEELKKLGKEFEENQNTLTETKKNLNSMEEYLAEHKTKAFYLEEQISTIMTLLRLMTKKDKKSYLSYYKKLAVEYKNVIDEFNKTFNIMK